MNLIFVYIIFLLYIFNQAQLLIVNDNFQYCTVDQDSARFVENESQCKDFIQKTFAYKKQDFAILSRTKLQVDGIGFACEVLEVEYAAYTIWIPYEKKFHERRREVTLDRDECMAMVISKTCYSQKMECHEDGRCYSYTNPDILFYPVLGEHSFYSYHCEIFQINIKSNSVNDLLFSKCTVGDQYCKINNYHGSNFPTTSIYWHYNEVIHECQFEKLLQEKLAIQGNHLLNDGYFFSMNKLQLEKADKCNFSVYKTDQGLFLSKDTAALNLISKKNLDLKDVTDLTRADYDKKIDEFFNFYKKQESVLESSICLNLMKIIDLFKRRSHFNEFMEFNLTENKISNNEANPIVIYNDKGNLLVANCRTIKQFEVFKTLKVDPFINSSKCYLSLPVSFNLSQNNGKNVNVTGYIQPGQGKIIQSFSNVGPCEMIEIKTSNHLIHASNSNISIIDEKNKKKDTLHLIIHLNNSLSYKHSSSLLNATSLFDTINEIIDHKNRVPILDESIKPTKSTNYNSFENFGEWMRNVYNGIKDFIWWTSIPLIILLVVLISLCVYCKCAIVRRCIKCRKQAQTQEVEMEHFTS